MGEIDEKAFLAACKEKAGKDVCQKAPKYDLEEKFTVLCSEWEVEIRKPEWHPFNVIDVDGQTKEIVREDEKKELGQEAHDVVVKALVEMNEYNPSGRYPVPVLWNLKENRRAPLDEAAAYMLKQWKANKNKYWDLDLG